MTGIGPRAIGCSDVSPQRPQRATAKLGIAVLLWREHEDQPAAARCDIGRRIPRARKPSGPRAHRQRIRSTAPHDRHTTSSRSSSPTTVGLDPRRARQDVPSSSPGSASIASLEEPLSQNTPPV